MRPRGAGPNQIGDFVRFKTLRGRLMHHNKIKVAVARELTAFIWERQPKARIHHAGGVTLRVAGVERRQLGFKLQSNAAR